MALPAILYTATIAPGTDIRGPGIAAALADALGGGTAIAIAVAFLGAWLLFKAQLDILEGTVRAVTDILWTGSRRLRRWTKGDDWGESEYLRLAYQAYARQQSRQEGTEAESLWHDAERA